MTDSAIIKVTGHPSASYKDGTARADWWVAVQKYDGKSVEAFEKAMKRKPPHTTKKGTVEPPRGWVNYFKREGLVKLEA